MKAAAAIVILQTVAGLASAQTSSPTLTTIHNFAGEPADGSYPNGTLFVSPGGTLYGTTSSGGNGGNCAKPPPGGCGTVFSLSTTTPPAGPWTETVWSFSGKTGVQPTGGLIGGPNGALLGLSNSGSVFALPFQRQSIIRILDGVPIILYPQGSLVAGANGVFYGVSSGGGDAFDEDGDVFSLNPPIASGQQWTATALYIFPTPCCFYPRAGVIVGANGVLYGTTSDEGAFNYGIVYSLTPPVFPGTSWTEATLYNFTGGSDGGHPYSALKMAANGVLYGTTQTGGIANEGTVFSLTPPLSPDGAWTESVVYSFLGGSDGANPVAGITFGPSGTIYGTTQYGGSSNDGTVFSLTAPSSPGGVWTEKVLHVFTGPDGALPVSSVAFGPGGKLYGTTTYGGSNTACIGGCGTVYELQ